MALDSATGKVLTTVPTGGALAGGVITYQQGGRQYIAFACGNVSRSMFGALGRPSIVIMEGGGSASDTAASQADPQRGSRLYVQNCGGCHGVSGNQVAGYDLKSIRSHMTPDQLVSWIMNPAPPMPKVFPEPLDEQDRGEIQDIAAYLMKSL